MNKFRLAGILVTIAGGLTFAQTQLVPDKGAPAHPVGLQAFADSLTAGCTTGYEKAGTIVRWLATHFDWTATDYKERTVEQIVERKGGNCNELAKVTMALLQRENVRWRKVQEINIHRESLERRATAEKKIHDVGNRMSVFGKRHNDHVWVEIYDEKSGEWFPADPSLGLIGEDEWLKARVGFGTRVTLNPLSEDMIVPMGVFAVAGKDSLIEDRTRHYVVDGLNRITDGRLEHSKEWKSWVDGVSFLDDKCWGAFTGKVNLHEYEAQIDSLASVYSVLRSQYLLGTSAKTH